MNVSPAHKTLHAFTGALAMAAIVLSAGQAQATPIPFSDDFAGPVLDADWVTSGDPGGHVGFSAGSYEMTDANGGAATKLQRFDTVGPDPLLSYTHSIELVLNPFGNPNNTQADFKWKSFGPDGFMEIVLNSFGDMRLFHNDGDGGAGNIQNNTPTGYSDGDVLSLVVDYDAQLDTLNVTYELNGGGPLSFYSGGGIDGPVDDLISNFVEVEVNKWGNNLLDQPTALINQWDLTVIPEPSVVALFGIGGLALMVWRRRK